MKNVFYLILSFFFSLICFSQEVTNDEYEIYGKLIGEQGYQFYPINFSNLSEFKLNINDTIYNEIEKKQNKKLDIKKLFNVALKYSINRNFKLIEGDQFNQIYFSPIYFLNKNEAYFIYIIKTNLPKPYSFFLQAKKENDKWNLSDYYLIN